MTHTDCKRVHANSAGETFAEDIRPGLRSRDCSAYLNIRKAKKPDIRPLRIACMHNSIFTLAEPGNAWERPKIC